MGTADDERTTATPTEGRTHRRDMHKVAPRVAASAGALATGTETATSFYGAVAPGPAVS